MQTDWLASCYVVYRQPKRKHAAQCLSVPCLAAHFPSRRSRARSLAARSTAGPLHHEEARHGRRPVVSRWGGRAWRWSGGLPRPRPSRTPTHAHGNKEWRPPPRGPGASRAQKVNISPLARSRSLAPARPPFAFSFAWSCRPVLSSGLVALAVVVVAVAARALRLRDL